MGVKNYKYYLFKKTLEFKKYSDNISDQLNHLMPGYGFSCFHLNFWQSFDEFVDLLHVLNKYIHKQTGESRVELIIISYS